MDKADLRHLVTGLQPPELRTLRAIINGKLSTRTINPEQQAFMQEVRRLKEDLRRQAREREHRVKYENNPITIDGSRIPNVIAILTCSECNGSIFIYKDLRIERPNSLGHNDFSITEGPNCPAWLMRERYKPPA